MDLSVVIVGFFVGLLIGLTGMGGGSLMTPILILFMGVQPTIAIGSDLLCGAATKIFGGWIHFRQKTVNLSIVFYLALGSIPASLLGVSLVAWLKASSGEGVEVFVTKALGGVLILVAVGLFLKTFFLRKARERAPFIYPVFDWRQKGLTVLVGTLVGFLVGLTSVGSGTLIVIALVFLFPTMLSRMIVGTDVFHGALLVTAAAMAHYHAGNTQLLLVSNLLLGSLPGVFVGSKLTMRFPEGLLRPVLASILMACGIKLI